MGEVEEEGVEVDALVLLLECPNWKKTTKNLSRPLRQKLEEAEAKSLNYPLLRNNKKRSHWSYQSWRKNPHQRKVGEKADNQLQPNRISLSKKKMMSWSQRLPEEERNLLVEPEEEAKPPLLPNAQEPPPPEEAAAEKPKSMRNLSHKRNLKR